MSTQPTSAWARAVKICGYLVIIPPIIGLIPAVVAMVRSFSAISSGGSASPATPDQMATAMRQIQVGLTVSAIASVALVVSVIGLAVERRRMRQNQVKQP